MVHNVTYAFGRISHFVTNWVLSTNHRRIAVMYFIFTFITGFTGLILATIIRVELAYPGQMILVGNAEKYLTVISLHGIIMVFFVVIPILYGAFGNFLLPTQLGIRDVAFPRLNSFMFWITPAGFVLLLHILLFDKSYNLTYWLNYSELRAQLRRRYSVASSQDLEVHMQGDATVLALRLAIPSDRRERVRNILLAEHAPHTGEKSQALWSNTRADWGTLLSESLLSLSSGICGAILAAAYGVVPLFAAVYHTPVLFMHTALFLLAPDWTSAVRRMHTNYVSPLTTAISDSQILTMLKKFLAAAGDTGFAQDSRWYLQWDESSHYEGVNSTTRRAGSRATVGFADYDVFSDAAGVFSGTFGAARAPALSPSEAALPFDTVGGWGHITDLHAALVQDESLLKGLVLPLSPAYLAATEWGIRPLAFDAPTPVFGGFSGATGSWEATTEGSRWGLHGYASVETLIWSLFTDTFSPATATAPTRSVGGFVLQLVDVWVLLVLRALDALNDSGLGDPFSCLRAPLLGPVSADAIVCGAEALTGSWLPATSLAFNAPAAPALAGASLHATRAMLKQYYHLLGNLDYLNDWRELKFEREIWRSVDDLSAARKHWLFRKKYYSNFYEPSSLINKVSIWMPNHLIPGWAFVTPYTSRVRYTALGKVDIALVVILIISLGSVFSSINYVITYRYIGAPTLKNRKELRSFFVDALLVGSRMIILANPALIIGIMLLLSDRHLNTSVFDFSGGGDTVLFQHLFWFFGHPEVYIVIIPCFGFINSLLPYYLRKRLSGRLSLQFSMYTIAFMAFAVWGHHMYMVGLANSVRTLYSTATVMISVPASTKILHWCVTLIQSSLSCDVGFLFLLSFMYFFVLGGLSGMFVAHIGFDVIFHDTFYVIGHFHVMFACATMCCIFAGFYFYFASIFGVRYSRFFAYLHFCFFVVGQIITIVPMMWLGYAGMPRRIMDYPSAFGGWHSIISSGHLLIFMSFIFFFLMIFDSLYENRAPISKTKGVSRLNTRLSFYAYEIRKLKFYRSKSLFLARKPNRSALNAELYQMCYDAEMVHFEYVLTMKKKS
jgi:cytochrome c oxidase subunit 1